MTEIDDIEESVREAEENLQNSVNIAKEMLENIPDKNNWRDLAVVTNEAIGQIFNTILEFAKPDEIDTWKRYRYDSKAKMIGELKILNKIYEQDLNLLNKIRVELAHGMKIDETKIEEILHRTHTYNYNKEEMDEKTTLQEQFYAIALKAIDILRHHHSQYVASSLNKKIGWTGSYYKHD